MSVFSGFGSAGFRLRTRAMVIKEFIQLKRDRISFGMIVMVPLMQLALFGYAINTTPRHLPTAVLLQEQSDLGRAVLKALENTQYFKITHQVENEAEFDRLLASGTVLFAIEIPAGFERAIRRGERPALLVAADATDPVAAGSALSSLGQVARTALQNERGLPETSAPPFDIRTHARYNPAAVSSLNIVPGLVGVILTMTMLIFTALSVTRELERGTMENLLAMPVRPAEIMVGKIVPYIGLGLVQVAVILVFARLLFAIPLIGSLWLLLGAVHVFIAANVTLGYTFSTLARTQMQAMQMTFFFFLPSILLSGFMFPFRGMPEWAQWIGQVLPLTHFNRIVRGITLKGSDLPAIAPELWPIAAFLLVVATVALVRYRRTLD
jgi:ABC-2 type transport system permease protein